MIGVDSGQNTHWCLVIKTFRWKLGGTIFSILFIVKVIMGEIWIEVKII